jgi:cobalt-zinc-cadmium efflux system membrane fusion protein
VRRASVLASLILACSGDHARQGGAPHEDHAHAPAAISITRWTDNLELFAEHPPAVVGHEVEFLAHLTTLRGFRALEDATVTLVLEGPSAIRAEATHALRPGIFRPMFRARTAGRYRGRVEVRTPEIAETFEGFTIEVFPTEEAALTASPAAADDGRITFLKEQQWRVPFDTSFIARRMIVPAVEVAGTVATPPDGSAEVGAAVAGRLVAPPEGLPRQGEHVVRGRLLASIAPAPSSPEDAARASLAVAEADARLARARSDLERAERLIRDQAISERELEGARREVGVAEEAQRAAGHARQLFSGAIRGRGGGSWRLTAPIDGIITEVDAAPGSTVSPDQVLFRIVDPSELWIRANVPEQDAAHLRTDASASYLPMGGDRWRSIVTSGEDATASLVYVGRTVDPDSRTVEVVYALRSPDEALRVGGLVRVGVPIGAPLESLAVPRSAIVDDDGRSVVYVQVEGEAFVERIVRVGPRDGAWVAITEGLAEGERIVTEGAPLVRLAARAPSGAGHGHVH